MYLANPWGLLGLLCIPAILLIHLYHRRYPPLLIAGSHLWGAEIEVRSAGRRRDRLPITATLLLELLAALLLTLIFAQPRFGGAGSVTHLVVVLDDSASMLSKPEGEPSFRDQAIQFLQNRMDEFERGSVVTLICTGARPVTLGEPALNWNQAREVLQTWEPTAPFHDFQPAWDLAAQIAGENAKMIFLSDHTPEAEPGSETKLSIPESMEVVALGQSLGNLAITAARWTIENGAEEGSIFLRITNWNRNTAGAVIIGRGKDQQEIFREGITVPGNETRPLLVEVPLGVGKIDIQLVAENDGLELDNSVSLIEPKIRPVKVAVLLPEGHSARTPVQRVLEAIPNVELVVRDQAHLVITTPETLPESNPQLWWLGIGPLDSSEQARENALHFSENSSYLLDKRNPLLKGLDLQGVRWGGTQNFDLTSVPLISVMYQTEAGPATRFLLAQLSGTQTTAYIMNLDLASSSLTEGYNWPILMQNLIELRRDELPGLRRWNYRMNEEIIFRLPDYEASEQDLELKLPGGTSRKIARTSIIELPPLDQTGKYELWDGEQQIGEFAINFLDPEESRLLSLNSEVQEIETDSLAGLFILDNPYSWLVFLTLALLILIILGDWIVLRPRKL